MSKGSGSDDLFARYLEPSPPPLVITSKVLKPRKKDFSQDNSPRIYAVRFQLEGKVRGVLLRSNCKREAERIGIEGYIKFGPRRTLVGEITGTEDKIHTMKVWLLNTGSPFSRVEKVKFSRPRRLKKCIYLGFYMGFIPKPIQSDRISHPPLLHVHSKKIIVLPPPTTPKKGILKKK